VLIQNVHTEKRPMIEIKGEIINSLCISHFLSPLLFIPSTFNSSSSFSFNLYRLKKEVEELQEKKQQLKESVVADTKRLANLDAKLKTVSKVRGNGKRIKWEGR
jgi:hypothetical protein